MARGAKGCRDCSRCNRSAVTKMTRGSVRVTANVMTLGTATAFRKKCGVCGHPLTAHTGQVVAVTNQQPPPAPVVVQLAVPQFQSPPQGAPGAFTPTPGFDFTEQLARLGQMHQSGMLDDGEFAAAKNQLLAGGQTPLPQLPGQVTQTPPTYADATVMDVTPWSVAAADDTVAYPTGLSDVTEPLMGHLPPPPAPADPGDGPSLDALPPPPSSTLPPPPSSTF